MADKLGKKDWRKMLQEFGFGMMSATGAAGLGTQIGLGGMNMVKGQQQREDEARKMQLELLGVDASLDDKVRVHQEAIAKAQETAASQIGRTQSTNFNLLLKTPGSVVGASNQSPGSQYIFTPSPTDPEHGIWSLPGQQKVTDDIVKYLPVDPETGKKPAVGSLIPTPAWLQARKDAADVEKAGAKKPEDIAPQTTVDYYVKQVSGDAANWNLVPPKWKEQVGNALAASGIDVKRLDAQSRAITAPQDPQEVAHWATQIQNDAKNWSLLAGNKGLQEAVRRELSGRGVNVTQLDAQTRQTAEFAHTVRPHIDAISDLITKLDAHDKLGPVMGRWNEFRAGTWGAGDPEYIKLRNNINLLDSAVARIHGGAKGGGSLPMIDYMHSMLSAGPKDAASMRAGLSVFNDWVKGYEGMAPGIAGGPAAGHGAATGTATPPPRPPSIPWDADAQYNPANQKWRFRPKGATEWQILPSP
jgi:hypothetical protein